MRATAAWPLLLFAAACSGDDRPIGPVDGGPPDLPAVDLPVDAPPRCPLLARHTVTTAMEPVFISSLPGDPRLFVGERTTGRILVVDATGTTLPTPFLDLGGMISTENEEGMKGLAFAPDFATSHRAYVTYTTPAPDVHLVLARAQLSSGDPNVLDAATLTTVLEYVVPTGHSWRVGGHIAFGPDGFLYMGVGDSEIEASPQDLASPQGKMIRIDPGTESPPLHYAVPSDNPFVGMPSALPEIWAYGIREPWRWSFDSMTGDLYIGEVGDATWEEIDVQPASSHGGENYGWPVVEGDGHCHTPPTGCTPPAGAVLPVYETMHGATTFAIMGGDVYHGSALPSCYRGRYFFGDYGGGWVRSFVWTRAAGATDVQEHTELTHGPMTTLAVDGMGEPYILGLDGTVDRIVPAP